MLAILALWCLAGTLGGQTMIYSQDFYYGRPNGWATDNQGLPYPIGWYYYDDGGYSPSTETRCMGHTSPNTQAANNWVFLQGISMVAGNDYYIVFQQKVMSTAANNLKVTVGTAQSSASQTVTLLTLEGITNGAYVQRTTAYFTPTSSGTYYFAFNCYSNLGTGTLLVDNVDVYRIIPPIPNPTSFSASAVSHTQIDLSWTKFSPSDDIMLAYNSSNTFGTPSAGTNYPVGSTIPGGGTVLYLGPDNGFSHTGLTQNTSYYYKIWSAGEASKDIHSNDSNPIVYSTGLTASATTYRTPMVIVPGVDFLESFNDPSFPPPNWYTQALAKTPGDWLRFTSGRIWLDLYSYYDMLPYSGAGMAGFDSFSYPNIRGILVTPPLDLPNEGYKLVFWMYRDTGLTNSDLVHIWYNTADNLTGATRLGTVYRYIQPDEGLTDGWYPFSFNLPAGSSANYCYVIFEGVGNYGNRMFVDDVRFTYEEPLPVELSSFTVTTSVNNHPLLTWISQSETNMACYRIYRGMTNDPAEAFLINPYIPASNTTQQQTYVYHDTEPCVNGTYYYWLESGDLDGTSSLYGPVAITLDFSYQYQPNIPLVTEINSIYPNPFNPSTTISFGLETRSEVDIAVYNARGQRVRGLLKEYRNPGNYRLFWDGADASGRACSSGQYYIVMRAGKDVFTRKAILVK